MQPLDAVSSLTLSWRMHKVGLVASKLGLEQHEHDLLVTSLLVITWHP